MSHLINHPFYQMNGAGNRIIVVDVRSSGAKVTAEDAIAVHKAFPFDQMMVLRKAPMAGVESFVEIYNNDGSMSGACGNGSRCVAWLLLAHSDKNSCLIETKAGILTLQKNAELNYTVDMGEPKLEWHDIPLAEEFADTNRIELQIGPIDNPILHSPSVVSMGNPHAIFFVKDPYSFNLERLGSMLEHHPIFPEKANISLVEVVDKTHLIQRVWERGAGITLACGSGACAALVAAHRRGYTERHATIALPGGALEIEWLDNNKVLLTGAVELEQQSNFAKEIFAKDIKE